MLNPGTGGRSALADLLALSPPTRIVWGLDRIRAILAALGDPQLAFRSLLIGGTNGKGSAAATCEAVLRAHGVRTGLYTSPHLLDPAERVRIEGREAGRDLLDRVAAEVLPLAERQGATFFEAITAAGLLAFQKAAVEVAVVEVGLGGRLDATNVLIPDACAITNVDLDHAEYLGDTLEAIAREKAGIIRGGTPVVLGPMAEPLLAVFDARATEVGAPLRVLGRDPAVEAVRTGREGTRFAYRSSARPDPLVVRTPLPGSHQALNAGLALALLEDAGWSLDPGKTSAGVGGVRWPGRFEVRSSGGGTWVLDVAHNPAGARSLAETLIEVPLPDPKVCLVAILGDKPWREMLDPLLTRASAAVFTVAPSSPPSRRWNPFEARAAVVGHRVEVEPEFGRALARARELAGAGTVIVTGSVHTVGDALAALDGGAEP